MHSDIKFVFYAFELSRWKNCGERSGGRVEDAGNVGCFGSGAEMNYVKRAD